MKVFVVAIGLAASLLLATGTLVLWQSDGSDSQITFENSPSTGASLGLGSNSNSTFANGAEQSQSKAVLSSHLRNLSTEEIEEAIALLKQERNLSEFELAMVTLALYGKHQDPEVAQVQTAALLMALDSAGVSGEGNLGDGLVFKDAERKILKEIMEMETIPDGLTPQQYLQQRLQELKETTLAEGHVPTGDF